MYVKKNFVQMKITKKNLTKCKKSEITAIIREDRGAAHSNCNLNYKIPQEIPVVFHNGSTYDHHFIIKRLAREFRGYFHCLGENTEKSLLFLYQFKK